MSELASGMLHVPLPGLPEGAVHVVVVASDCTDVSTTVAAPIEFYSFEQLNVFVCRTLTACGAPPDSHCV